MKQIFSSLALITISRSLEASGNWKQVAGNLLKHFSPLHCQSLQDKLMMLLFQATKLKQKSTRQGGFSSE